MSRDGQWHWKFILESPDIELEKLKSEIKSLQRRLADSAKKGQKLSWDTELLLKKAQHLKRDDIISCTNPNWKNILESIAIGIGGICINDVRTVEEIKFIAAFAERRQLTMTYGNRMFLLEPRYAA